MSIDMYVGKSKVRLQMLKVRLKVYRVVMTVFKRDHSIC